MADKSMKVTYGEYVVEADEKGSISVTKGGELCGNAKGALREIAQQAGFEVNPDWTSRQFGSKLMKFLIESTPSNTSKEPTPDNSALCPNVDNVKQVATTPTNAEVKTMPEPIDPTLSKIDFENISIENLFDLCKNGDEEALHWVANKSMRSSDFKLSLQAYFLKRADVNQEAFLKNLRKLKDVNFNASSLFISLVLSLPSLSSELIDKYVSVFSDYTPYANVEDLERTCIILEKEYGKTRRHKPKMYLSDVYNMLLIKGIRNIRCNVAINYSKLFSGWDAPLPSKCNPDGELGDLRLTDKWSKALKGYALGLMDEGDERYNEMKEQLLRWKNEDNNKNQYNELLEKYDALKEKYDELEKKKSSSSSSSSSSSYTSTLSRSSGDEKVRVEMNYKVRFKGTFIDLPKSKTLSMTKAEYKNLLNGSMKARIAYVHSNCGVSSIIATVSDVNVKLL